MSPGRWLGLALLVAIACFSTWKVDAWRYGKQMADLSAAHQTTLTGIATAATKASEKARQTEQQRQRDIDQVRFYAADQKQKDDVLAARQRADNDSLHDQTRKLLADKSALKTRLAERGKTIDDLVDLLTDPHVLSGVCEASALLLQEGCDLLGVLTLREDTVH